MKWIPMSERLPENGHYYLWCSDMGSVQSDYYGDGFEKEQKYGYNIVAWMPLPRPYTADRKTEPTISKMEQVEDEPKTQMKTQNSNLTFEKDECAKEYEELGLKELKELIKADRKTENSSEKPNNCEKCKWWNESYGCHWKEGVCHYVPKAIIPKQCVSCDSASRIIKAYSQGFKDGADAVKAMPQTFTADGIVFAKMDEPQTEKGGCTNCDGKDLCNNAFTEISQYCGAYEPQNGYQTFNGTSVYVSRLEDEPQTDCAWR